MTIHLKWKEIGVRVTNRVQFTNGPMSFFFPKYKSPLGHVLFNMWNRIHKIKVQFASNTIL